MKIRTAIMRKNILLATIVFFTFGGIAKSYGQSSDLYEIREAISNELDKQQKVYTDNGSYNKIFYYKFIGDNLLQVRQFSGIIRSGESESADVISITIDMTQVTGVYSNKTNYGYKCIELTGTGDVFNIQYKYQDEHDWSDIEYKTEIALASDSKELIRLFKEWSELKD